MSTVHPTSLKRKPPYITVSAKGLSNGQSSIPNDGADFGPDTLLGATAPNQYGPPYTQTSGIQEAINYSKNNGNPSIKLGPGLFFTNVPISVGPGIHISGVNLGNADSVVFDVSVSSVSQLASASSIVANASMPAVITSNGNYAYNFQLDNVIVYGNHLSQYGVNLNCGDDRITNVSIHDVMIIDNTDYNLDISHNADSYFDNIRLFTTPYNTTTYDLIANLPNSAIFLKRIWSYSPLGISVNAQQVSITDSVINAITITGYDVLTYIRRVYLANTYQNVLAPYRVNLNNLNGVFYFLDISDTFLCNGSGPYLIDYTGTAPTIALKLTGTMTINYSTSTINMINPSIILKEYQGSENMYYIPPGNGPVNMIDEKTYSGTTAGTVIAKTTLYSQSIKQAVFYFNGYENDTTTNQTLNYPLPFSSYAAITFNNTGLTISASTTGITITAPNSTTTYSGIVIVEGY